MTNGSGGPGPGSRGPGGGSASGRGGGSASGRDLSNLRGWLTGLPGEGELAAIVGVALGTLLTGTEIFSINQWKDVFFAFYYVLIIGFAGYSIHLIGIAALLTNWKVLVFGIGGFVGSEILLLSIAAAQSTSDSGLTLHPQMAVAPIILLAWLVMTIIIAFLSWMIARPRSHT